MNRIKKMLVPAMVLAMATVMSAAPVASPSPNDAAKATTNHASAADKVFFKAISNTGDANQLTASAAINHLAPISGTVNISNGKLNPAQAQAISS